MKVIFLDNAATTPLEPRVKHEMVRMMENFGNPSSIHVSGRGAKVEVEVVRKRIAQYLEAEPGEIFFTSGGTEADNMALFCSVRDLGVKRIITTTIEHHAVGHPVEFMVKAVHMTAPMGQKIRLWDKMEWVMKKADTATQNNMARTL